jgi:oxygen-independent coproporphyrinogen-3 oxidase
MSGADIIGKSPVYEAYTYAYPHKTAYRPFSHPVALRDIWRDEPRDALFLYLHVPFCEMRCGFCNLFTSSNPQTGLASAYLDALRREAQQVKAALDPAQFARIALGGGTPTFLDLNELQGLLETVRSLAGDSVVDLPFSVEASPATVDRAKLQLLREYGADRISIGVQTFIESESAAIGRRQSRAAVAKALDLVRSIGFPRLNIDLIYGLPGQTLSSWLASLAIALTFTPEELFLYPLYVRPLTGLGRRQERWDDQRLKYYRAARDLLLSKGYTQMSMRMFTNRVVKPADVSKGPAYCAQEDGMVGLGCGARSYTRTIQYSTPWAVTPRAVRDIIAQYISTPTECFGAAEYGFILDREEQQRRYVAQTLVNQSGLHLKEYESRFASNVFEDLPRLSELIQPGWAIMDGEHFRLTAEGLEHSDVIGPWLYSERVRSLMSSFELK